jgi:hypothetical protein
MMDTIMYDQSSVLIVAILLVFLVLGIEAGYRIGQKFQARFSESARAQGNSIRASMLGLLALLLGFTFAQSLQRFDARSAAVVDEANAIGTAYLRADLAPPSVREPVQSLLRDYLDLRVKEAAVSLANPKEEALLVQAQRKQAELWQQARQVAAEDRDPVTALFVQSINELIDSFGRREAEVTRHVPESVLLVLFTTFVMTGFVVGFACGAEQHRPSTASYIAAIVIVLMVFVIIDLDHPRRGLIEVPQESLIDLQTTIQADDES